MEDRRRNGTNLAYKYEYDLNAVPRPSVPERAPQRLPKTAPARKPLPRLAPAPNRRFWFVYMAFIVIGAVLLGSIVAAYSELTAVSIENSAMKSDISALRKERSALSLLQNEKISAAEIEKRAKELGMVKTGSDNVLLLRGNSEEEFVITDQESGGDSILAFIYKKFKECAGIVWEFVN